MKKTELAGILILVLFTSSVIEMKSAGARFLGSVYIKEDGSIEGTKSILQNGSTYTLKGAISGGIQVQKSNIVIDGAGYTVYGNGGTGIDLTNGVGQDPSRPTISNVTVKNLRIMDCYDGIETNGGGYHTFYGNYISNCSSVCISLGGCSHNSISFCTLIGPDAIGMYYQSNYNTIRDNNIMGYLQVWLSGYETVDSNYWNATSNSLDKHPLLLPVSIPAFPENTTPVVIVVSPENKIYNSSNVSLVFTVNKPVNWTGYSLNGDDNVTIAGNTTLTDLPNGNYNITVYATDRFGNTAASDTIRFNVEVPEPFPTVPVAAASIAVIIVVAGLLVYHKKRQRGKSS